MEEAEKEKIGCGLRPLVPVSAGLVVPRRECWNSPPEELGPACPLVRSLELGLPRGALISFFRYIA